MSIFEIIGSSLLVVLLIALVVILIWVMLDVDDNSHFIATFIIAGVAFIGSVFIGIGLNTREERIWVQKYLIEKETIEKSLDNDKLTGYERVQLVNKATELNGELAEKKTRFGLWDFVVYDNTIYDNVEFIKL